MKKNKVPIHLILVVVTLLTTTLAGVEWMYGKFLFYPSSEYTWEDFFAGFQFSLPFLAILTVHEFGHYFAAKWHNIKVTLPYYIPVWFGFILLPSFGTMGAFIRIKDFFYTRRQIFDIGVAGPVAGFIVAVGCLYYGFTNLPPKEYIFKVHPEYAQHGLNFEEIVYKDSTNVSFQFGGSLLFNWMADTFADPGLLPHPNEMIHYPFILAGYLALFFTALNLLPIGQLDGGHVILGLFGVKSSRKVSEVSFLILLIYAGLGIIDLDVLNGSPTSFAVFGFTFFVYLYFLYISISQIFTVQINRWLVATVILFLQFVMHHFIGLTGYNGWLLFAFLLGRFLGVYHPPVLEDNLPLSLPQKIVGYFALLILILSFSPQPFIVG